MIELKRFFIVFKLVSCSCLYSFSTTTWAQQETIFSLYRYHLNLQNPAAIGLSTSYETNLSVRSQWVGVEDAPETQAFTLSIPHTKTPLHLGFSILNDKTFIERQTQFNIDFSYALTLTNATQLFLGLKAGGVLKKLYQRFNKCSMGDIILAPLLKSYFFFI